MEDSGFLNAVDRLDEMHRVDRNRVLVLRTGSNYSMERPGHDLSSFRRAHLMSARTSRSSLHISVGSTVVNNLVTNWSTTRDHIPGN